MKRRAKIKNLGLTLVLRIVRLKHFLSEGKCPTFFDEYNFVNWLQLTRVSENKLFHPNQVRHSTIEPINTSFKYLYVDLRPTADFPISHFPIQVLYMSYRPQIFFLFILGPEIMENFYFFHYNQIIYC